jgi:O-antigen ligase
MSAHNLSLSVADGIPSPAPERVRPRVRVPDRTWDVLVIAVSAYLLAAVGRVHQLFPMLEPLHPALLAGLVAILIYLTDRRPERRLALLWTPPAQFLVALTVWMILAVPGALVRATSLELVLDNFLKTLMMFFVIAGAARGFRDVERLAMSYFAAATVYAGVVVTQFDLGGAGDGWRLGHLYYYDANDFATFAVTAMPIGLYAVVSAQSVLKRVVAGAMLALLALAFVWTGSRGGFIALLAVAAYIVLRYRTVRLMWRLTGTALVGLVLLVAASDRYWAQMETILAEDDYNRTEETGRFQIWSRGIGYVLGHPVLGVGPNNFPAAEGMLSPQADRQQLGVGVRWNAAHNSFLQVAAELGIPGFVMFIGMFVTTFAALIRAARHGRTLRQRRPSQLSQALTASLVGFIVGAFFLSLAYSEMLYTLIALSVALYKVTRLELRRARELQHA